MYYYLSLLIIELSYPNVLYKSVQLSSKSVDLRNLMHLSSPKAYSKCVLLCFIILLCVLLVCFISVGHVNKQHSVCIKLRLTLQTNQKCGELLILFTLYQIAFHAGIKRISDS